MAGSESGWPPTPCLLAWPLDTLPSLLSCKPALLGAGRGSFQSRCEGQGCFSWALEVELRPPPQAGCLADLLLTTSLAVLGAAGWACGSVPSSLPFQKAPLAEVGVEGTNISSSSRKRPEWVCRVSAGGGGATSAAGWARLPSCLPTYGFQDSSALTPLPSSLPALPGQVLAEAELPHIWVEGKSGEHSPLLAHANSLLHSCQNACLHHPNTAPFVSWGQMGPHLHAYTYMPHTDT